MNEKIRVAIVFGGQSTEHEVSRFSAQSIADNLDKNKYDVVLIGITREGRWLSYNGPAEKLGTGEWEAIALSEMNKAQGLLAENIPVMDGGNPADSNPAGSSFAGSDPADRDTAGSDPAGGNPQGSNHPGSNPAGGNPAGEILAAAVAGGKRPDKKIDVVFPVLHGLNGEDGTIQGMLELAGIPYVGCGVLGSALGMDKYYAKIIFEKEGLPQGKYLMFSKNQFNQSNMNTANDSIIMQIENTLSYPCFVKPCNSGSSVGVGKACNREELISSMNLAFKYDKRILVEEFIDGREIECSVLGNHEPVASTVGEIIPCNEFYDYDAKYCAGNTSEIIIPAQLPEDIVEKIREYTVRAFKALDCAGLARVDFFVHRKTGCVYINELNTMPGFTRISMYPKLWEASGMPYSKLLDRLVELAVERHEEKMGFLRRL